MNQNTAGMELAFSLPHRSIAFSQVLAWVVIGKVFEPDGKEEE